MIDEQERMRLIKLYSEMSDNEITDMLLEDEQEYKQQPYESYEILMEEARRRGLDKKIEERKRLELEEKESQPGPKDFVIVYAGSLIEVNIAKGLLEGNNITTFLEGGVMGTTTSPYAAAGGPGAIKLIVEKKDTEKAKFLIDEYIKDK